MVHFLLARGVRAFERAKSDIWPPYDQNIKKIGLSIMPSMFTGVSWLPVPLV